MRFKVGAPVWISSLYFVEGVPAAVICEVATVIFFALGRPQASIARDVSILGMPWMLKPLWSCLVDLYGTKRRWIVVTQFVLGGVFAAAAGLSGSFVWLWWLFFAAAVVSATHDIAADGFYIVALDDRRQSLYSGLRSVFYRVAMIGANGGLIFVAAKLGDWGAAAPWRWCLGLVAAVFGVLALFHLLALPYEARRTASGNGGALAKTLRAFLIVPDLWRFLVFLLLFRFAEAQLSVMSKLFLLDPAGGGLSVKQYGVMAGSIGVAAMLAGGVLGGAFASRVGLGKALLPMALALNVPDVLYAWWAFFPVRDPVVQASFIGVEQFGYGFGFTGYMLVMICLAGRCGAFQTTIFSLLSCLMIAGLRIPGLFAGWIFEHSGVFGLTNYQGFFLWVLAATLASFAATLLLTPRIPSGYGRGK